MNNNVSWESVQVLVPRKFYIELLSKEHTCFR